ncbi:hypothetical protein RU86_GL001631 [Lactococcus piscium]|uniref:HNH endonuclease 5 domain-containing protein n=1 Tax=Pseudolactococcus piscium TaxID=1364 RepID=A0A2A5RUK9_9LACT|nr:hypothetical protein [Lactococcus piscium]PCS04445.1 hypothetical protein RU86_GL001631 [Lactococcus piscium]
MGTKEGVCILCQQEKQLNLEHVPPQAVGNKGGKNTITGELFFLQDWDFNKKGLPREIKRRPYGNAYYTLCIDCNSKFGGDYVGHYVNFAKENKEFLYRVQNTKNGSDVYKTHSMRGVNPLRIAKEIVAMFFSINGNEDEKDKNFLDSVRLYLQIPSSNEFPIEKYEVIMNYYSD